jgi:NADPH:quinone reductase-like Zn-dependent oxidoreductase
MEDETSTSEESLDVRRGVEWKEEISKVFHFEQIVEAHRYMEENRATGKLVVLVDERPRP